MNYWLSPQGQIWKSEDLGRHYEMAIDIIIEKFPELLNRHCLEYGEKIFEGTNAVEILENKGYIRYMDWSDNPRWIIYNQKPNKIQIRKMFDLTNFVYQ